MELYINDILVELDRSIPFPLTYHISDIRNIDKRKGSSSKTIELPGTRINTELMSSVFSLTTTDSDGNPIVASFDPSVKVPARYYQNGVLQFEGICQLTECVKDSNLWTFKIVLFADQVDIFTLLKNYKIRELGWSEYNHALTYTNQKNSASGSIIKNGGAYNNYSGTDWLGEGYYYGLIDYGFDRVAEDTFEVGQIPPQVFIKSIVDKMFSAIDVTYSSSFIDTQQFKRLLLAYEGGVFPEIDSATATANSVETDQDNPISATYFFSESFPTVYFPNQDVWRQQVWSYTGVDYASNSGTEVDPSGLIQSSSPIKIVTNAEGDNILTYSGDHDVSFTTNIVNSGGSPKITLKAECQYIIRINNTVYQTGTLWNNEIIPATTSESFTASFDLNVPLYLNVSDEVTFEIRYTLNGSEVSDSGATGVTFGFNVTATNCELDLAYQQQTIVAGSTINIKQFMPDMDCATFFKGLITMFNLYVKPSASNPRELEIEPLNSFYNGSNNAINWTKLVDHSKELSVTPTVNFASKEYNFKFKDDADYWNARYFTDVVKQYGSKVITSASQFATGETKFELPFANKLLGQIPTTDLIVPRNFQVKTDENGSSEINERRGKPFIVQIKVGNVGTKQTANWNWIDESDVLHAETDYAYVGHLDDIDSPTFDLMFDVPSYVFYDIPAGINYTTNNLYSYHEKFIKEIVDRNGKMLTCYVHITPDMINVLDFGDLINIDGVVYRLQKIENYDPQTDDSTKCEFIRLIEGESIQTYTIENTFDDYLPHSLRFERDTEDGTVRDLEDDSDTRRLQ